MDYFPLEGFNHMINIGLLICDSFVWSGCSRCSVFWEYLVYPNMVSEHVWRVASGLIKVWNRCCRNFERVFGLGFSMNLWHVRAIPLRPEHLFYWKIVFFSPKTVSVCSRNTHFGKCEGIMLQWQIFFLNLSYFISLLLDIFCFSLGLFPSLTAYALFRAPCAIAANQKQ